jgi:hypothetical protein
VEVCKDSICKRASSQAKAKGPAVKQKGQQSSKSKRASSQAKAKGPAVKQKGQQSSKQGAVIAGELAGM